MSRRFSLVITLSLVALAVPVARAGQQATPPRGYSAAATGTGQIGGVVTTADGTGQPVRRAIVGIAAAELRGNRQIATDDRGRFLFTGLPAGRYQLSAGKPGYLNTAYGQKRFRGSGTAISLADGQKELDLRLALPRGAVVTGRVTDEFGQPISGARIEVRERTTVNGQVTLMMTLAGGSGSGSMTDDRGTYRLYGMPPGTFLISVGNVGQLSTNAAARATTAADLQWATRQASAANAAGTYSSPPPPSQTVAFTDVFHPSAVDPASATPIELEAGMERAGVDIVIRFVPVARVAGTVTMPDGRPATGATVILLAESSSGVQMDGRASMQNSRTTASGEFAFPSATSGHYTLMVQASSRAAGGRGGGPLDLWGMTNVSVDGRDVTGVALTLQPGMTFSGRIVVDAAATTPPPDFSLARVSLAPVPRAGAALGVPPATIGSDGTFTISGAAPGLYRITASTPTSGQGITGPGAIPVWTTKSVLVQGQDVLDRHFEIRPGGNIEGVVITLTDRIASLSGKLVDGQGKPAPEYFVIVLPVDRAFWVRGMARGPRSMRPASDGAFSFNGLPPGEYYVAAATDFDSRELYDASFLDQLIPAAIKLSIAEGEKRVQDLKIGK